MKRTLSFLAAALVTVLAVPVGTAGAEEDYAIYKATSESSAIQAVGEFPLRVDPSVGYALSKMNQEPDVYNKASVVEPGLVGRVALYIYFDIIDVPLSSECFYPDPPGPAFKKQSAVQQPTTKPEAQDKNGVGTAICRTDNRPSGYAHAASTEGDMDGVLSFRNVEATSSTVYEDGLVKAASESTLRDITISGVLKIGSIHSSVNTVAGETEEATSAASTISVGGASVQGHSVAITDAGIVVKDPQPGTSPADAQKQVNSALEAAGLTVTLVKASHEKTTEGGQAASAYSGGILVTYANPAQETTLTYILGQSTASTKLRDPNAAVPVDFGEDEPKAPGAGGGGPAPTVPSATRAARLGIAPASVESPRHFPSHRVLR